MLADLTHPLAGGVLAGVAPAGDGPLFTGQNLIALASAAVAILGGWFAWSNSRGANRNRGMELQHQFTQQMAADVQSVRKDAAEAKADAARARADADDTARQHRRLQREMAAMQDWIDGVVRARDAYVRDHPTETVEDTGVLRMLRIINGGPSIPSD